MSRPSYMFDLPRTFDPAEFLPTRLLTRADDARWLVSTILRKSANRDVDPWNWVRLHSDIVRRVMDGRAAPEIIRSLAEGGAIKTVAYRAGARSTGYRLADRYDADRSVRVPITDPRLRDRIERERQRIDAEERQSRWLPIHAALDAEQRQLTIDRAADGILDGLPKHCRLCQDVLVSRLRHREFPFTVSSTGRVFNAVTGLKRELRQALRIGGERLGSVDIRCA